MIPEYQLSHYEKYWGEITMLWLLNLSTLIIRDFNFIQTQENQTIVEKVFLIYIYITS